MPGPPDPVSQLDRRPHWIEDWEGEQPILVDWLKSLPKPVGLMACNDICGLEVLPACAAVNLRVHEDVVVVGVDNDEMMCELSSPSLSSVALDLEKAGYEAAGLLDGLMSGSLAGGHVAPVEPVYVVTRQSSHVSAQDDPSVASALRFIKNYAGQATTVPDMVDQVGVSRRSLERRFLRAMGHSILGEITRCRLERAQQLLRETNLPVYRVAAESGFGSVKAFSRAFHLAESCSPAAFRLYSSKVAVAEASAKLRR